MSEALDREAEPLHELVVSALDKDGRSCSARLSVKVDDVNDKAPIFENTVYLTSMRENVENRTVLLHVHATDQDIGEHRI